MYPNRETIDIATSDPWWKLLGTAVHASWGTFWW